MRLLEHQSKRLLAARGLAVTEPRIVSTAAAAGDAVAALRGPAVLKAQVPFGGRGKSGGVLFVRSSDEARHAAMQLLGMTLRGATVETISVEPKVSFTRELYLGVTWDTRTKLPAALLSSAGGIEVEASREYVARENVDPAVGLPAYRGREMARRIGLAGKTLIDVGAWLHRLAAAFVELDAVTLEINPLVETEDGQLIALDAHLEIEDDALYRQQTRLDAPGDKMVTTAGAGRAPTPLELEAQRIDAMDHRGVAGRVVEFDGDLALLIGGGGASLTVFDAIRHHGGKPANYCEVGGNPTEAKVAALTQLLLQKPGVRKMAVIMNVVNNTRADVMARGLLQGVHAAGRDPADTVVVFRIPGSWEQEANFLLAQAGITALGRDVSLDEAARLAVEGMASYVA